MLATLNIVAGPSAAGLDAEEVDLMIATILRAPPHYVAARRHQPIIPAPASACQN